MVLQWVAGNFWKVFLLVQTLGFWGWAIVMANSNKSMEVTKSSAPEEVSGRMVQ
jgi:hypothetical protein